jgi:serine/threonine protein kinase
MSKLIW